MAAVGVYTMKVTRVGKDVFHFEVPPKLFQLKCHTKM